MLLKVRFQADQRYAMICIHNEVSQFLILLSECGYFKYAGINYRCGSTLLIGLGGGWLIKDWKDGAEIKLVNRRKRVLNPATQYSKWRTDHAKFPAAAAAIPLANGAGSRNFLRSMAYKIRITALRITALAKWRRKSLLELDRFAIANNDFRAVVGRCVSVLIVTSQKNDCICASLLSPIASLEDCISFRRGVAPHGALARDTLDGAYDIELTLDDFCLSISLD